MPLAAHLSTAWRRARRPDSTALVWLAALLLLVGAALLFVEVAEDIGETDQQALDERVLKALREPGNLHAPIGPKWLPEAARDVTALGSVMVLGVFVTAVCGFL